MTWKPATTSSFGLRNFTSERGGAAAAAWALAGLAAAGAVLLWAWSRDRLLLYGDATAHVAIARRIVDSATPGLAQWGSVWLPLPHLLQAPLVLAPYLWRTGLSGALVSWLAFGVAVSFLYRIAARAYGATAAGWAALAFCFNPSLLYLAAVPMTESVYLACFLGLVDACAREAAWEAGAWGCAASLCRYDGWFVLPFAAVALWRGRRSGAGKAARFSLAAGLGPLFWFAYNRWYFDDALAFSRGPYSARQIYVRSLRAGAPPYPGDHHLGLAALYYGKAVMLTCGVPLGLLAVAGLALLWGSGRGLPRCAWMLLLPPAWYVWAVWSGNVPIFVPQYWPHGYYNLRYGVQALPAIAVLAGATIPGITGRFDRHPRVAALAIGLVLAGSYLAMLAAPGPPAYAEAAHNAPPRLAMEDQLAAALSERKPGERVLAYLGSFPGAFARDGIPLRETVNEGNYRLLQSTLAAPHRTMAWVVVETGTSMAKLINRGDLSQYYDQVAAFSAPGNPEIDVYRRRER